MAIKRLCSDCGQPTLGSRCRLCQAKRPKYNDEYRRNRATLLANSDVCWICGQRGADTADHVIPLEQGGGHGLENLRPAHEGCNKGRSNRLRAGKDA